MARVLRTAPPLSSDQVDRLTRLLRPHPQDAPSSLEDARLKRLRRVPTGGGGTLRELASWSATWAPLIREEDEALANSLEFVSLRLQRLWDRLEGS